MYGRKTMNEEKWYSEKCKSCDWYYPDFKISFCTRGAGGCQYKPIKEEEGR
jgi:hypothetical protein